jgi:hypothetical protein
LTKLEKTYRGKAAIVFIDVWKNKEPAKRLGIRAIPTQIFLIERQRGLSPHRVHERGGYCFAAERNGDQLIISMAGHQNRRRIDAGNIFPDGE